MASIDKSKKSSTSSLDRESRSALEYHEFPNPGKLEIRATKPLANPRDMSRAYSPGVAQACLAIQDDPLSSLRYTAKGNLVAVVTNGTAALGLGDIGPLASKPIMEGKAVLFKHFAHIDCFDIEIDERDPERLADHICSLSPTFGAINLEDIKAPDCFIVERICRERMDIPVFHDDQHGTAIVVGSALTNALELTSREFSKIKIVSTGGGAAGIACLNMLVKLGVRRENIYLFDLTGLVHDGRTDITDSHKSVYSQPSDCSLSDAMKGADVFLGLSGPGAITADQVASMSSRPIILALANPTPEIMPEDVFAAVPDALMATGRTDYPNQVNNVLCFPFIFRGALDVGAREINDAMQISCVRAIAELARLTSAAETAAVYGEQGLHFGPDYLIPKPFDPRLLPTVASAVAQAAIESDVATKPISDIDSYRSGLEARVYRSSMIMRNVFNESRSEKRRIVFAEGEDERVLRTAHAMLEETVDTPILIGRPNVVSRRCSQYGLPDDLVDRVEIVDPENDSRYRDYWQTYHSRMSRSGISPALARAILRTNTTVIAAVMVSRGEADSLVCGTFGNYSWHLHYVEQMLGTESLSPCGAFSLLIMDYGPLFVGDTHVNPTPTPAEIADMAIACARHVRRFGIDPKVALCSNSQFGTLNTERAQAMRSALEILDSAPRDFLYEGEMPVDAALDPEIRRRLLPDTRFSGSANVLVFSNSETASGVKNSLKCVTSGVEVGPILMGMGNKAHIVTPSISARGLLNVAALAGTPVQSYA